MKLFYRDIPKGYRRLRINEKFIPFRTHYVYYGNGQTYRKTDNEPLNNIKSWFSIESNSIDRVWAWSASHYFIINKT